MHTAVALALIGLLGTLGRLVPAWGVGADRPAVLAQLAMSVCWRFTCAGVKSFKEARRARLAGLIYGRVTFGRTPRRTG